MAELLILFFPSLGEELPHCNTTDCDVFIAECKCVTTRMSPIYLYKSSFFFFFLHQLNLHLMFIPGHVLTNVWIFFILKFAITTYHQNLFICKTT